MGVRDWKKGFESERGKEYVNKKGVPEVVKYADGSVGVRVRMKRRCLPVKASGLWMYEMEV